MPFWRLVGFCSGASCSSAASRAPERPCLPIGGQELFLDDVLGCPLTTTSVPPDEEIQRPPQHTALHPNMPKSFNPVTTIRFDLDQAGPTRLCVYDLRGRMPQVLVDRELPPGRHRATWNGRDRSELRVASDIYVVRLEAPRLTTARKMVLLK
jgi:hypothetical protein